MTTPKEMLRHINQSGRSLRRQALRAIRLADGMTPGTRVDYHSVIDGLITDPGLVVADGPFRFGEEWCVRLVGKRGPVSVLACTKSQANDLQDKRGDE